MRGKRKLSYINPQPTLPDNHSERRFKAAAARYYYYTHLVTPRLNYDAVICALSDEFYLSADYLSRKLPDYVAPVLKEKPSINDLRKQFPHLNWK